MKAPSRLIVSSTAVTVSRFPVLFGIIVMVMTAQCAGASAGRGVADGPPPNWGQGADLQPGPFVWSIEGLVAPVHILGTMHTEPLSSVPTLILDLIPRARVIAFEVDPTAIRPELMAEKALLAKEQSLDRMISVESWSKLRDQLKGTVPETAIKKMRPWLATSLLVQKASGRGSDAIGMDVDLFRQVRRNQKQITFVETMAQQFELLDSIIDAKSLEETIASVDKIGKLMADIAKSYRTGDVQTLSTLVTTGSGMSATQLRALFGARNERWIPIIEQIAGDGGGFVVVGAGHLLGNEGLVALLRSRGHAVTRVLAGASEMAETSPKL